MHLAVVHVSLLDACFLTVKISPYTFTWCIATTYNCTILAGGEGGSNLGFFPGRVWLVAVKTSQISNDPTVSHPSDVSMMSQEGNIK